MSDTVESPPVTWVETKIREMVRRIVEGFHPEKIILFGSHARGDASPDSDVDHLVVMRIDRGQERRKAIEIRVALGAMCLPKDVVVVTPEEMERYRDVVDTIVYPALREGRLVYRRPA